jgi:inner membrane protein
MPTILTHAALPLIAAWGLGPKRLPPRLAVVGALVAVVPDVDVVGRAFGVSPDSLLGHRGVTHSLAAALLLALAGSWLLSRRLPWRTSLPFLSLASMSHGLTDMLTDGGKGIALLWPFSSARLFAPFRPVEVSPILLRGIENGKLPIVLASELIWLVAPATLVAILFRRLVTTHIDLARGQS